MLTIPIIVFAWRHTSHAKAGVTAAVIVLTVVAGAAFTASIVQYLFYSKCQSLQGVLQDDPILCFKVKLPRHASIRAGQYTRVWVPRMSFLRSQLFLIVWWSYEGSHTNVELVPQSKLAVTFANRLRTDGEGTKPGLPFCFMTPPYGKVINLKPFSALLFVASGSGIIAQIPYIMQAILHNINNSGCKKMINVLWVCKSSQVKCAEEWLNRLIWLDNHAEVCFNHSIEHTTIAANCLQRLHISIYCDELGKTTRHVQYHEESDFKDVVFTDFTAISSKDNGERLDEEAKSIDIPTSEAEYEVAVGGRSLSITGWRR